MEIKKLKLGYLKTNCYILTKDKQALVIDPADNANKIIENIKGYDLKGILVTHHHPDHIGALDELENYYHLKHNTFADGFDYEVIKTPGHCKDLLTFYFPKEKIMFTGDFIFYHTIGRCDLLDSSTYDMQKSLHLIRKYPDDIIIYPGHGKDSILKEEKTLFDSYF